MVSTNDFYENGLGDRFVDSLYQSEGIKQFLREELNMINAFQNSIDLLIEVGCMHGLHLDWAIAHQKAYLGFDLVKRYIDMGRQSVAKKGLSKQKYRFIVGNAEKIAHLMQQQHVSIAPDRCLLFFPFNSFGNMQHAERVIASLQRSNLPFVISSYQTSEAATMCRYEYYTGCGYKNLLYSNTEKGVCFSSTDGFWSIAYHPTYLIELFKTKDLSIEALEVPLSNVFYQKRM